MNEEKHRVNNKVVITVEGGVADIRHFPLDISICINDLDADSKSDVRHTGNRAASLSVRWEYLMKRVDHDCDLILRVFTSKLLKIFPHYYDPAWRYNSDKCETSWNLHLTWCLGSDGLLLSRPYDFISLDALEVQDRFEFVQALMMDHELLLEELSKYGENYRKSGLVR